MSRHRDQIAEEARRDVKEEGQGDSASDTSGTRAESGGNPTGEEQAATNRNNDPPA